MFPRKKSVEKSTDIQQHDETGPSLSTPPGSCFETEFPVDDDIQSNTSHGYLSGDLKAEVDNLRQKKNQLKSTSRKIKEERRAIKVFINVCTEILWINSKSREKHMCYWFEGRSSQSSRVLSD